MNWPNPVTVLGNPPVGVVPILWGHFPHKEDLPPYHPWDYKERPVLAMAVAEDPDTPGLFQIAAAMGTTKVDKSDEGWFLVHDEKGARGAWLATGLQFPTSFDLNFIISMYYNSDWFAPPPQPPFPKRLWPQTGGLLPFYTNKEAYKDAKAKGKVKERLIELGF